MGGGHGALFCGWSGSPISSWSNTPISGWGDTAIRGRGDAPIGGRGDTAICGRGGTAICGWGGATVCRGYIFALCSITHCGHGGTAPRGRGSSTCSCGPTCSPSGSSICARGRLLGRPQPFHEGGHSDSLLKEDGAERLRVSLAEAGSVPWRRPTQTIPWCPWLPLTTPGPGPQPLSTPA